jgi:hypothetical protein
MTHRKWEPGTLYAKAMRDITNEHNDTVDAWQAAEAEAERLGRANSDLCDQIAARAAGWELDVTADEAWAAYNAYGPGGIKAVLYLCRSRIRPVFECKECAKWEADCAALSAASRSIDARIAARAALEVMG